jgi:glycosyltransferase involved in cell wall biosynthesis
LNRETESAPTLSVVIPMYNEMQSIQQTVSEVQTSLQDLKENYEIILVDDGSIDNTVEICKQISLRDPRIRLVMLNRNMGHMSALETGLTLSLGQFIVSMDADLQDNPKDILEMLRVIRLKDNHGNPLFDVVQTTRLDRKNDSYLKRMTAGIYYRLMKQLTGQTAIPHAADFRMISRKTLEVISKIPEKEKVYRLLLPALGFRIAILETKRETRFAGKSKYNVKKMIGLAINSIINFSNRPLRIITQIGVLSMMLMIVFCFYSVYLWYQNRTIPGWTSLVIIVLISNSLILISLGVVGAYVGKVFEQVKGRPNSVWTEFKNNLKSD